MKRISGGQLSLGANATLLSSHAGGSRAATGDRSFAGQAKQSTEQSRVSPPPAREPTGQVGRHRPNPKDEDSESSLRPVGPRLSSLVLSEYHDVSRWSRAPRSCSPATGRSVFGRGGTRGRRPESAASTRRAGTGVWRR